MWPRCCSRSAAALLAAVCALQLACASLSVHDEQRLGTQMARQVQGELLPIRDDVISRYVAAIAADILRAAGPQPFAYHFQVVEDDDINAFALPAGYIYIHSETILRVRNVDELAGVIAHEIGHVAERHVAANYSRTRSTNLLYQFFVATASLFGYGGLASVGGGLASLAVLNSFGREAEMEADAFAVRVMPAAGYDPVGLLTFFETLQREPGPRPPTFLSSHPTTAERIAATRARLASQAPASASGVDDRGRLEIIQRRIELLTGKEPRPTQPTPL